MQIDAYIFSKCGIDANYYSVGNFIYLILPVYMK